MTIQEKEELIIKIEKIEEFNIAEEVAKYCKDEPDQSNVVIGKYPLEVFIKFFNQAISYLKSELKTDNFYFYPIQPNAQPVASINLNSVIDKITNHLESSNISELASPMGQLITYENYFGFWHLSTHKIHSATEKEIKTKAERLDFLNKKLEIEIEKVSEQLTSLNIEKEKLDKYTEVKKQQLESISSHLTKSSQEVTEISRLWEDSVRLKGEIETTQSQTKESLESIKNQVKSQHEDYDKLKSGIEQKEKEIADNLNGSLNIIQEIKNSEKDVKDRIAEATRLLGLSADAALGGRFSQREIKIRKALFWWRIAIGGSIVLAISWAVVVFINFATKTDLPYLDFLVNVIKTSPGFVLMGFVMAQYNKERTVEEEYAFRAAIAETISAYADLLENQDDADKTNDSRQKMLLEAIQQVYSKPEMNKEKIPTSFYKSQTRELLDVLKEIKLPNK